LPGVLQKENARFYSILVPRPGADFLQRWKIKLDPATEEFLIDEKALEIVLI